MKYIKTFSNHSEYTQYKDGGGYITPNLSYCVQENEAHFNKYVRDYSKEYFTIEALEDGDVYFKYQEWNPIETQRYMEYSKDGGETWVRTTNVDNEEVVMDIPMSEGEIALVRGDNDTLASYKEDDDTYYNPFFYSDTEFSVYGNIMSLIHGDDFIGETTVTEYMFYSLFYDVYGAEFDTPLKCLIINAENLILPATTLASSCYNSMFRNCTSLTTAPELPATTLAINCYASMFYGCRSLTTAPELPATTLASSCYNSMFGNCTSLTTAPELPAITLVNGCYGYMFSGCTGLTTAPELPAITLVNGCYGYMFQNCSSLNYIKAMFTTQPSTSFTRDWVSGVSSTGTFVKNSSATWNVTGSYGVPSGWTVQTASA